MLRMVFGAHTFGYLEVIGYLAIIIIGIKSYQHINKKLGRKQ